MEYRIDDKMQKQGYKCSCADPCIYICSEGDKIAIITIWVDNLLLFADLDKTMLKIKEDIQSEWETMGMSEPTKIVSIEITLLSGKICISQKKNI